jgi:hypothetical protein
MQPIQYFAYGSNMLRERLLARQVVLLNSGQPAFVNGFKLLFNKKSNGSSKANLVREVGSKTWGVLFSVNSENLDKLDDAEGAPIHYRREYDFAVRTESGHLTAMTYLAQPDKILTIPDSPYDWYLALIMAGGKACPGIPLEWVNHIRQIGNSKESHGQPQDKYAEAVAQLKTAGYDRWQELLINATEPIL